MHSWRNWRDNNTDIGQSKVRRKGEACSSTNPIHEERINIDYLWIHFYERGKRERVMEEREWDRGCDTREWEAEPPRLRAEVTSYLARRLTGHWTLPGQPRVTGGGRALTWRHALADGGGDQWWSLLWLTMSDVSPGNAHLLCVLCLRLPCPPLLQRESRLPPPPSPGQADCCGCLARPGLGRAGLSGPS